MIDENVYTQVIEHVMTLTDDEFAAISVGTLAYSFNVCRYKLSRQFKSQAGMTLEHFLFKEKMGRAAFLLKAKGNITVKEVADKIGFCSSGYFIRKFREFYGIVPGRYRTFKIRCSPKGL